MINTFYDIVKAHGGMLHFKLYPATGTTVILIFLNLNYNRS
jgi:hypothetical protein